MRKVVIAGHSVPGHTTIVQQIDFQHAWPDEFTGTPGDGRIRPSDSDILKRRAEERIITDDWDEIPE